PVHGNVSLTPPVLKMPKRSSSHAPMKPLSVASPRRGPNKPHHATKRGQAHSGGTRCRTNRLEFFGSCQGQSLSLSKPPGPFLASNHKQGHDALSSHTDRVTLRKA